MTTLTADWRNRLYFGDNLDIMREHIPDGSVDLIYLDPPFKTNVTDTLLKTTDSFHLRCPQRMV